MRTFQVLLVDNIVNAFAFVLAYMLRLGIIKLFVMLNGEVLPLNFLFKLFSLNMALGRLLKAILDFARIIRVSEGVGERTTFIVVAIVEFIYKLEIMPVIGNGLRRVWHHKWHFLISVYVGVEGLGPVYELVLVPALLGTVAKTNGLDAIGIQWIAPSRVI